MRRIAVFTGTRAEYGLIRSVILHLQNSPEVDVHLIVSGSHLATSRGMTMQEIEADGVCISKKIDMEIDKNFLHYHSDASAILASMGKGLEKFGMCFDTLKPDVLLVLGDRYECVCAVLAATVHCIPVAHISGGDTILGVMDEAFRHSITKMSHLHFASCEAYRKRVIQLGEQPERVWNVGALGVENALTLALMEESAVRAYLQLPPNVPYFLCTFHPVTLEQGQELVHWREVQSALDAFTDHAVVVTGANADPGGGAINQSLAAWAASQPERVRFFDSLGVVRYLSAAKYAACVVGNSSSGVMEIPSLGTPVVDIGIRQKGRIRSQAVLHCETTHAAIVVALGQALTPAHRERAHVTLNPYQGENTARRIAHILCEYPLQGILMKPFYDIQDMI